MSQSGEWKPQARWGRAFGWLPRKATERFTKNMDPERVLKMRENSLAWALRFPGPDSEAAMASRWEVAEQLRKMGRTNEARLMTEAVVTSLRRHRGDDHPQTLSGEGYLFGDLVKCVGDLMERAQIDDAEALIKDATPFCRHLYDVRLRIFGPDDWLALAAKRLVDLVDEYGS